MTKYRRLTIGLIALAWFNAGATPARAGDFPGADFDQGVDASKVLNDIRQKIPLAPIDKASLILPLGAVKGSDIRITGPVIGINLPDRVRNSQPYQAALEYPPLIESLEPPVRDPLKAEWSNINTMQTDLLSEANNLEAEDRRLYARGEALDRNLEWLERREKALQAEVGDFNRQCANRPLPPDEYEACRRWRDDLEKRIRAHNAEVEEHNNKVIRWRSEVADLRRRAGTQSADGKQKTTSFLSRVSVAWEQQKIVPFTQRAEKALAESQLTIAVVQAQGGGLQKSIKFNQPRPATLSEGLAMLDQLWSILTDSERRVRNIAIEKARDVVRATAAAGGVTAPPKFERNLHNPEVNPNDARIDVVIYRGRAFVPGPCCQK